MQHSCFLSLPLPHSLSPSLPCSAVGTRKHTQFEWLSESRERGTKTAHDNKKKKNLNRITTFAIACVSQRYLLNSVG